MALRLPTQVPRRTTSYPQSPPFPVLDVPASSQQPDDDESTQWVLFSPSQAQSTTTRTRTNSTERTAGASRVSDFASFGTGVQTRSVFDLEGVEDANEEEEQDNDIDDEDGTELDSLDDGLHAFRAPSLVDEPSARWNNLDEDQPQVDEDPGQVTPAVLPTHDGLGSFQASSQTVQDKLWQHEQYNPQRRGPGQRLRRQSSVQRHLDMVAEQEQMTTAERERWQRVEKWRMEQSRVLLQEVERETRRKRRRNSRVSGAGSQMSSAHRRVQSESTRSISEPQGSLSSSLSSESTESGTDESFWKRITRKVIRDLIGIDDSVLSVIFGESLPDEALGENYDKDNDYRSARYDALNLNDKIARELDTSESDGQNQWQTKLLQRIAHELGVLVHQLCDHPGAFTTYLNMSSEIKNEYAGMPLNRPAEEETQTRPRTVASSAETNNEDPILSPRFSPTLPEPSGREHAAHWGIEEDDPVSDESIRVQQEKDYWERELDIMVVFRYLRNRFSSRGGNYTAHKSSNSTRSAVTTTPTTSYMQSRRVSQDASRRAAIIRQHHPLVAQSQSRQSRHSASASAGAAGVSSPILRQHFRRASSSCASQSAKLSTISSRRMMTGSSRNYWDIGGSVDSGSAVAPVGGGLGSWGDV